jgi:hypothetical protein
LPLINEFLGQTIAEGSQSTPIWIRWSKRDNIHFSGQYSVKVKILK